MSDFDNLDHFEHAFSDTLLGGLPVLDVRLDEAGQIHHVLDGELPPVGAPVRGELDRQRRREHMALHTGQHLLSQALLRVAQAPTVSSRLGETACTIDVRRGALSDEEQQRIEALVNQVIDDDVPVRAYAPDPAELAELPLRRRPKVSGEVRVVQIGDFDFTPCGGTHCTRAGQVGLVRLTGVERHKGGLRIGFVAGPRARGVLFAESAALRELAGRFSCRPLDVPAAVDKLGRDGADAAGRLTRAYALLAGQLAERLLPTASPAGHVIAALPDAPVELLRAVATCLSRAPGVVALLAGSIPGGVDVVVSRGSEATFDCGRFLAQLASSCGGRGGGRPEHAEGRLPAGVDWAALATRARGAG